MRRTASEVLRDLESRVAHLEKDAGIFDFFSKKMTLSELEDVFLERTPLFDFVIEGADVDSLQDITLTIRRGGVVGHSITFKGGLTSMGGEAYFKQAGAAHSWGAGGGSFPSFSGGGSKAKTLTFYFTPVIAPRLGSFTIEVDPKSQHGSVPAVRNLDLIFQKLSM